MNRMMVCMLGLLGATTSLNCQRSTPAEQPADTERASWRPKPSTAQSTGIREPAGAHADAARAAASDKQTLLQFDQTVAGQPPSGFVFARTGQGAPGKWIVKAEADAPSAPNVLAQIDADAANFRFPIAAATEPFLVNVRVTVRCKMVSGKVDQACGIVLRYRDENNYYLTRANALEKNIRFYHVKDGKREELATWDGVVRANVWHEYRIEARGKQFTVYWNGAKVLDHEDDTLSEAGRVGVWTKADSITYFDDLIILPL